MTVLYVVSDREGAGKTALCATLARVLERRGGKAAVFKPIAAAESDSDSDPDATTYRTLLGQSSDGWPIDLPDEGLTAELQDGIKATFDRVSGAADHVLVEGSCRLSEEGASRLADVLDAKALVVSRYRSDLAASDFEAWREALGDRLLGFVINGLTRYKATDARAGLLPSLESEGLVCFGMIPEDRRLLGVTVDQLAEHLNGRFVADEGDRGALVEHLMVGGMGMDPGELYFGLRESKAVIARGDRPDVQMPALETPTACMVLTKGIEPIEYVKYEAEQEEVPVMVVPTDTLATMDAVNTLIDGARFDHPLKLSRFEELVEQHVDLARLFEALGVGS